MSKTVGLRDDLYEKLEQQAKAQNTTIEIVIEKMTQEVESAHLTAMLARLKAEGVIATFDPIRITAPDNFQPIIVKGKPVSEIIIEERR